MEILPPLWSADHLDHKAESIMKYMRWCDNELKWLWYEPPQADLATLAREARTELYLEARDEAIALYDSEWITRTECRHILIALYKQRYTMIMKPPVNYVINSNFGVSP
jgi:hypothetical protein